MQKVFTGKAYKEDFVDEALLQRYLQNSDYEFIYLITCSGNGVQYVGKTNNAMSRYYEQHRTALRGNKHYNRYLQSSYNKYGANSFVYKIIDIAHSDHILALEMKWIADLDTFYNGFNGTIGGEGSLGYKWTVDMRKAKSLSKARLSEEDIISIYHNDYDSLQLISYTFGVSINTIKDIQSNRRYTAITEHLPEFYRECALVSLEELTQAGVHSRYGSNYKKVNGKRTLLAY